MSKALLKRYTNIPSLLHILTTKTITLLDPEKWDDKNDSFGIRKYRDLMNFKTTLALCFTEAPETYHHWKVYAGDSSGVCITFNKESLINSIRKEKNVTCRHVDYKTIEQFRSIPPKLEELPFVKRIAYQDECEFRVVHTCSMQNFTFKKIDIPLHAIERISVSPWVHRSLLLSLKETVSLIEGCDQLDKKIFRSTITENSIWKKLINDVESIN